MPPAADRPADRWLSPRQFAGAAGVSESSVKRLVDGGELPAERTPGGHRRIRVAEAVRFLRRTGRCPADPALLGLTVSGGAGESGADLDRDALRERVRLALLDGREEVIREVVTRWVLRGRPVAEVCDDPLLAAYRRIRSTCEHPSERCVVLHRALSVAREAAAAVRDLLEPPAEDAPAAVLADVGYEVDSLPVHLAAAVARDRGLRVVQLGYGVDPAVLAGAVPRCGAAWVWLSAGGGPRADHRAVARALAAAAAAADRCGARLVLHGDAVPPEAAKESAAGERVDSLAAWDALLRGG